MRFSSIFFGFCALFAIFSSSALGQPISRELPRASEISLRGQVLSITAAKAALEMEVVGFSLPNGKSSVLKAPKNKTIQLNGSSLIDSGEIFSLDQLKVGEVITATGLDTGTAVGLRARIVWREERVENARPLTIAKKPDVVEVTTTKHKDILPPPYQGNEAKISVLDIGFDYGNRIAPHLTSWTKQPEYFAIFELAGKQPGEKIDASRLVFRRAVSSNGRYLRDTNLAPFPDSPQRLAFIDSRIDPRWEYIDVDMDIKPKDIVGNTETDSTATITLNRFPVPAKGQEIQINRQFKGGFGTTFTLLKVKYDENGKKLVLVWQHEMDPATTDIVISSYNCHFDPNVNGGAISGGISRGSQIKAEHELTLVEPSAMQDSKFELNIAESAPLRQKRDGFERVHFRLPVAQTLQTRPLQNMPEATFDTYDSTVVDDVSVKAHKSGSDTSGSSGILWVKTPTADSRRGLFWRPVEGKATLAGTPETTPMYFYKTEFMDFYWHGDGTTVEFDESGTLFSSNLPETSPIYDAEFKLEKKLIVETNFTIPNVPILQAGASPQNINDNSENTLLIRKVMRYESPKDIARFMDAGETPQAGVAVVFETMPFVTGGQFMASVLDIEDNLGRSLRSHFDNHRAFFQGDLTVPTGDDHRFHTALIAVPPDAQTMTLWIRSEESGNNAPQMTVRLRDIPNDSYKDEKAARK